jgi:hypothetical protein
MTIRSHGNARHTHRHRAIVDAIRAGRCTIPSIIRATGYDDPAVRQSIAYLRMQSIVESCDRTGPLARYELAVPHAAAMAALPIETSPPTFDALEEAFGVPLEIASVLAVQRAQRLVEGMGMSAP